MSGLREVGGDGGRGELEKSEEEMAGGRGGGRKELFRINKSPF